MNTKTLVLTHAQQTTEPRAQIAIINNESWCVIGEYFSRSGLFSFASLPQLPTGTPIVNLQPVQCRDVAQRIIKRHSSPAGIDNPQILARLLVGLGATMAYSV